MNKFKQALIGFYIFLKAAGHNFEKPIKWASGTKNPFYVNNRKLQSIRGARKAIGGGLALLTNPKEIDYVYAIPKAGIAPATLLALEVNKPILVKLNGKYFSLKMDAVKEFVRSSITPIMKSADVVVGTFPLGIIFGVAMAEELDKPFLFVREAPKTHGTQEQVEGIAKPGDHAVLVAPECKETTNYTNEALYGLKEEKGIEVCVPFYPPVDYFLHEVKIDGLKIAAVEDLVSTGGSSLEEVVDLIKAGASVEPISIFDYGFPDAKENFAKHGLVNKSLVNFKEFMHDYSKKIDPEIELKIWKWYEDQPNWGDKNGHPKE